MTSADSLSLILRCLDEIERKLDRMMEELRTTPTAIGYSVPPMPDAVSRLQLAHDEINKDVWCWVRGEASRGVTQ
jgi:hypothetical protein